jgi:predicted PurR-regulated permease PerM
VDRFVGFGLRRGRVVMVLYLFLFGGTVLMASWFIPILVREASAAMTEIPTYAGTLNALVDHINVHLQPFLQKLIGAHAKSFTIPFRVDRFLESVLMSLPAHLLDFAHLGLWVFIIPFSCFFGLAQGQKWIDTLFEWTPSEHVESLLGLLAEINAKLGGYFRGILLESMCVGLLSMAGLGLFGVKGAVLLGCVTGLLNLVPFLAPVVGGSLALLVAYFQGASFSLLLGIFFLFLLVRLFDDFVLIPLIIGHHVQLHPLIILFAVLAGVEVGGFFGLIFAIPVTVIAKVVLGLLVRTREENLLINQQHYYS